MLINRKLILLPLPFYDTMRMQDIGVHIRVAFQLAVNEQLAN